MTGMLASVVSLDEARLVAELGADIIDLKDPSEGALGALPLATVRLIVNALNGIAPVSATIGDIPFSSDHIRQPVMELGNSGVDIIKIGVFGDINNQDTLAFLSRLAENGNRFVLVFFAEDLPGEIDFAHLKSAGIHGVMIDTRNKQNGNLPAKIDTSRLGLFCQNAKTSNLLCGLAGSIGVADIPGLLELQPDYLGFRGAMCENSLRSGLISESAVRRIRQMIPGLAIEKESMLTI